MMRAAGMNFDSFFFFEIHFKTFFLCHADADQCLFFPFRIGRAAFGYLDRLYGTGIQISQAGHQFAGFFLRTASFFENRDGTVLLRDGHGHQIFLGQQPRRQDQGKNETKGIEHV